LDKVVCLHCPLDRWDDSSLVGLGFALQLQFAVIGLTKNAHAAFEGMAFVTGDIRNGIFLK